MRPGSRQDCRLEGAPRTGVRRRSMSPSSAADPGQQYAVTPARRGSCSGLLSLRDRAIAVRNAYGRVALVTPALAAQTRLGALATPAQRGSDHLLLPGVSRRRGAQGAAAYPG